MARIPSEVLPIHPMYLISSRIRISPHHSSQYPVEKMCIGGYSWHLPNMMDHQSMLHFVFSLSSQVIRNELPQRGPPNRSQARLTSNNLKAVYRPILLSQVKSDRTVDGCPRPRWSLVHSWWRATFSGPVVLY
jgi:hypothetical protein